MLRIRKEQVAVFEQAALQSFEDEMVEHLKRFTPKHSEVLGEKGVRQVIRFGMERAGKYGLTNRGPARLYIELIFILGSEFDSDPQLPWAAAVLKDPTYPHQMARANGLYEKAMQYIEAVAGPDYVYAKQALRRAKDQRFEGPAGTAFDAEVLARLRAIYPEKCEYVGEPALRMLVARGRDQARQQGMTTSAGSALFVGLMFTLGHGFATDPQHPWIAGTLTKEAIGDPNKRAERLYSKVMTYLQRVLAYLG